MRVARFDMVGWYTVAYKVGSRSESPRNCGIAQSLKFWRIAGEQGSPDLQGTATTHIYNHQSCCA